MSLLPSLPYRLILLAGLLAVSLPACGRRGAPEAPLTTAEVAAQQQSGQARGQQADDDDDGVRAVTVPTPAAPRRRTRAYTIPKEPFVLDPLL